ncbi:MAG: M20/M25/M40 family metallo-hydrolase [Bacteroidetes bacterium]|nr:M20/M25/M40 family metallo-hydrolase [Bacteroidota bacterium]
MSIKDTDILYQEAVALLQQLIAIPSLSRMEDKTADCIEMFLQKKNITAHRLVNNVWCTNKYFDDTKPCILLNSHHDTVKANENYTLNPYEPTIENGKLFGLGSTDAGASLVSLLAAFLFFYHQQGLAYNILFAATAEEEISGSNGIEKLLADAGFAKCIEHKDSFAIVGEPTQLELAIAEKGLLVLDCTAKGVAGHAARNDGENAIYHAMNAIEWFKNYRFDEVSDLLGEVKMTVTSIATENKAHNVIPAQCSFVVDIRITELYSHQQILQTIVNNVAVQIVPRSTRLKSSIIPQSHPVVIAGMHLGKKIYGSPTLSDKALMPIPALKCGPGYSAQSHSANEFVLLKDIEDAVNFYVALIKKIT